MTFPPGPASDEEDPPGWDVRGDEQQAASAVWQAVGSAGARQRAAEPAPAAAETMPLAVGPESLAVSVPVADPVRPPRPEPPAVDLLRPAVGEPAVAEPAAELSPLPAAQAPPPAGLAIPAEYPQLPPAPRRGRSWAAMLALLAIGLCALAGGAAGAVRQLLPREFSLAQQRQIQTWEMTRRWRAQQAGQIFPATLPYLVSGTSLNSSDDLALTARRLGIATPGSCSKVVSKSAAAVLAAGRCAAVLRATYLDASESMVATVGVAAMPTTAAATAALAKLGVTARSQTFAVHAFPLARSAAAGFRQAQRQYSIAMSAGPYVILGTAGFTDGRRHVPLSTDDYIKQEMNSLVSGLVKDLVHHLGKQVPAATCPGAPGC